MTIWLQLSQPRTRTRRLAGREGEEDMRWHNQGMHSADDSTAALAGVRIVSIALNLPGPAALRRLVDFGAAADKVEPPDGDPLAAYAPDYYRELHDGVKVHCIDLKSDAGQSGLSALLDRADLLLTSQRPTA